METRPYPVYGGEGAPGGGGAAFAGATYDPDVVLRTMELAPTPLARRFFSRRNIDWLQRELASYVLRRTGVRIGRQSDEQLVIMMRYVYRQSGRNVGGAAEVARLNTLVLREAVPQVGSGIEQHLMYLHDASQLAVPLPRGQATTVKGLRTAELARPGVAAMPARPDTPPDFRLPMDAKRV